MTGSEHPLERLMDIEDGDCEVHVTTTSIRLLRRIGEAVQHACRGEPEFHYNDEEKLLRVRC
jgi:hypothetical protein